MGYVLTGVYILLIYWVFIILNASLILIVLSLKDSDSRENLGVGVLFSIILSPITFPIFVGVIVGALIKNIMGYK